MNKAFLDSCIWIELLLNENPSNKEQSRQSLEATSLYEKLKKSQTTIMTIKAQIIEIIQVIIKRKKTQCNKELKRNNMPGISSIKEMRTDSRCQKYVNEMKKICEMFLCDIKNFATDIDDFDYNIDSLIDFIDKVDVNDYIYYQYCKQNDITLYTFDSDFKKLDYEKIVIL